MKRILIIRGGAIGDFILILPTLRALRERFPDAALELLAHPEIAALAVDRFYATAVRSIDSAALSSFFSLGTDLDARLSQYLLTFDLVVSYIPDADGLFATNLRRAGVRQLLVGPAKIDHGEPAAQQLFRPLEQIGLTLEHSTAHIFLSERDRHFGSEFLRDAPGGVVALHPGSGGARKCWPLPNWIALAKHLLATTDRQLVVVGGEADDRQLAACQSALAGDRVLFAVNLSLPQLAAVLATHIFVGHDSGISHLAAAVDAKCLLLFGPTDPEVWAPRNERVKVIRAPGGEMKLLEFDEVRQSVDWALTDE